MQVVVVNSMKFKDPEETAHIKFSQKSVTNLSQMQVVVANSMKFKDRVETTRLKKPHGYVLTKVCHKSVTNAGSCRQQHEVQGPRRNRKATARSQR